MVYIILAKVGKATYISYSQSYPRYPQVWGYLKAKNGKNRVKTVEKPILIGLLEISEKIEFGLQ